MTPDEYCQKKTASSGSSFYYSFLFLPEKQRLAIMALYAFCREVDDVVDECSDTAVARTKLQWWREEITRLFQDQPRHPVTQALQQALKNFNLAEEHFLEIIDGMEMDLEQTHYNSFKELSLYCYRAASVVGLLTIEIFGYENRDTIKYAKDLGMAFQLTNILRDVKEDVDRGRVYLPAEEMQQFGVTQKDLMQPVTSDKVRKLFEFQAKRAQQYYDSAFQYLSDGDRYAQRSGVIMSAIYRTILNEIENDGYKVLEHRMSITPLRKLWIAWRTFRKLKKYKKAT